MTAAAIFAHPITAGQALAGNAVAPMDGSSNGAGGSNSSGGDSATISANDFLTLLVTEMQNQDPTADTDPNEYVDQLVQVNSLEQLININQTLATDFPSSSSATSSDAATGKGSAAPTGQGAATGEPAAAAHKPGVSSASPPVAAQRAPGNLSVPTATPAAERVAHALGGHTRPGPAAGRFPQAI